MLTVVLLSALVGPMMAERTSYPSVAKHLFAMRPGELRYRGQRAPKLQKGCPKVTRKLLVEGSAPNRAMIALLGLLAAIVRQSLTNFGQQLAEI